MTRSTSYAFSDQTTGGDRHAELVDHLGTIFDRFTCRRLTNAGVPVDGRILELGAGSGSVALWLAERAGPGGEILATDTEPADIPSHPQLRVLRHDIVTEPLPGKFYLIHARAVLVHLPERQQVLDKLVDALAPGGVLVIEEFADEGWRRCVLDAPDIAEAQRLLDAYHQALVDTMRAKGSDPTWGRRVNRAMRQAGLVDIDSALGGAMSWPGGTAGCMLPYTMIDQMRPALQATNAVSGADLDALSDLLRDPRLTILNSLLISTTGRKPN